MAQPANPEGQKQSLLDFSKVWFVYKREKRNFDRAKKVFEVKFGKLSLISFNFKLILFNIFPLKMESKLGCSIFDKLWGKFVLN